MTKENYIFKISHLQGIKGIHRNKLAPLSDPVQCLIGTALSCHIVLESEEVRDVHCRIFQKQGEWYATAVNKDDKIIVNHDHVKSSAIHHRDTITIGRDSFMFLQAGKEVPFGQSLSFRYIEETFVAVLVREDETDTRRFNLGEQTTTIGSEKFNDIVISDQTVSSNHGKIKSDEGCHSFVDLKSTNGSKINDTAVDSETIITAGDEIRVGTVLLTFGFIRKDKTVKKEGGFEYTPLTILLLIVSGLIILAGMALLTLVGLTLYSDIPPFGPTPKIIIKKLWVSEETSKLPFVTGTFGGENTPAIAITPSLNRVVCLGGKDAFPLWSYALPSEVTSLGRNIHVQLSSDGNALAVTSKKRTIAINSDGKKAWETPFGDFFANFTYIAPLSSTNYSKTAPVSAVTDAGEVVVIRPSDGTILSRDTLFIKPSVIPVQSRTREGEPVLYGMNAEGRVVATAKDGTLLWQNDKGTLKETQKIITGDLESDGLEEIIAISKSENDVFVIESVKGMTVHSFKTEARVSAPVSLALRGKERDITLVLFLENNSVHFYSCSTGKQTLWKDLTPFGEKFICSPCLYDINRDTYDDLVLSTSSGTLAILSGKDLSVLAEEKLTSPSTGIVSLADINGDRRIDIIHQLTDGHIEALTVNCPSKTGEIILPRNSCFHEWSACDILKPF